MTNNVIHYVQDYYTMHTNIIETKYTSTCTDVKQKVAKSMST